MAPLQLFLAVKSCACEIERQITMAGARRGQVPCKHLAAQLLRVFSAVCAPQRFGEDKASWILGWEMPPAEGLTELEAR